MTAYANDPRVRAIGGAGFEVTVSTPSGREMVGRVRSFGGGWESYWAEGEPLRQMHETAEEGIESFLGAEATLRRAAS